jgi:hypothetical protein
MSMTITEFLEARIAEDEAGARNALEGACDDGRWGVEDDYGMKMKVRGRGILIYDEGGHTEGQAAHIAAWDPARALAECAAKLAILKHCERLEERCGDMNAWNVREYDDIRHRLAAVYADHPEYKAEWAL